MIGVLSRRVARIPQLEVLLGECWKHLHWWLPPAPGVDKVAGWGLRGFEGATRRWASARGLTYLAVEDGFLRSVAATRNEPRLSVVTDDIGLYQEARAPSRLELLIASSKSPHQWARAQSLVEAWQSGRVSQFNDARELAGCVIDRLEPYALVVDQSLGDPSIPAGLAARRNFELMLEAALDECRDLQVIVLRQPYGGGRFGAGHFSQACNCFGRRVSFVVGDVHPVSLIERAQVVYVVSAQIGFESLLWDKPVRTFGMPFYAGWGLTRDEIARPARRTDVSLEDLVHATLVDYTHGVDPETGVACSIERLIEHVARQRRHRERYPARLQAVGFPRRSRGLVRSFFAGSDVEFVRRPEREAGRVPVIAWRSKAVQASAGQPVLRADDGFLRSVGLGAERSEPVSWVIDSSGVHFDASGPSDLETLLRAEMLDDELRARAAALRQQIIAHSLTQQNLDAARQPESIWLAPEHPRIVLVAGEIPGDAARPKATLGIESNTDLLRAVRAAAPDAYIVYQPHPEVVAGLWGMPVAERECAAIADEVALQVPLGRLLSTVHEVHVLRSLVGFEALIRGHRVVTWGAPFYAGWGLTFDQVTLPQRNRELTLDELLAVALILYPTYVSVRSRQFTTPERALTELIERRNAVWVDSVCRKSGLVGRARVRARRVWIKTGRLLGRPAGL